VGVYFIPMTGAMMNRPKPGGGAADVPASVSAAPGVTPAAATPEKE